MANEIIVIKSVNQKNTAARILFSAGIALLITSYILASIEYNYVGYRYGYKNVWDFFVGGIIDYAFGYIFLGGVAVLIVSIIINASTRKCELTVTDKRVYGKEAHGKDIDLPLNQISSIHAGSFHGVTVLSMSGAHRFYLVKNKDEVMKALSYLLSNDIDIYSNQHGTQSAAYIKNEAEDLKRLKELLDCGVITQDEFSAKKKQILGL